MFSLISVTKLLSQQLNRHPLHLLICDIKYFYILIKKRFFHKKSSKNIKTLFFSFFLPQATIGILTNLENMVIFCLNLVFFKFFLRKMYENDVQKDARCLHNRRERFSFFFEKRPLHVQPHILQKRRRSISFRCAFVLFLSSSGHLFGTKV